MFNPFAPLSEQLLDAFVKAGKVYFVRQTFKRGKTPLDENIKGYYLITHHSELGAAQAHYGAIAHDPNRYLYDWGKEEDQKKLKIAAGNPEGYKVFAGVFIQDWERHITDRVKNSVKMYIGSLGWRPGRNETVTPDFYIQFGDLYLKLKFRNKEVRVRFEDIEIA
jgi:hypothetical protein